MSVELDVKMDSLGRPRVQKGLIVETDHGFRLTECIGLGIEKDNWFETHNLPVVRLQWQRECGINDLNVVNFGKILPFFCF